MDIIEAIQYFKQFPIVLIILALPVSAIILKICIVAYSHIEYIFYKYYRNFIKKYFKYNGRGYIITVNEMLYKDFYNPEFKKIIPYTYLENTFIIIEESKGLREPSREERYLYSDETRGKIIRFAKSISYRSKHAYDRIHWSSEYSIQDGLRAAKSLYDLKDIYKKMDRQKYIVWEIEYRDTVTRPNSNIFLTNRITLKRIVSWFDVEIKISDQEKRMKQRKEDLKPKNTIKRIIRKSHRWIYNHLPHVRFCRKIKRKYSHIPFWYYWKLRYMYRKNVEDIIKEENKKEEKLRKQEQLEQESFLTMVDKLKFDSVEKRKIIEEQEKDLKEKREKRERKREKEIEKRKRECLEKIKKEIKNR